jgi:hypothetical protein
MTEGPDILILKFVTYYFRKHRFHSVKKGIKNISKSPVFVFDKFSDSVHVGIVISYPWL